MKTWNSVSLFEVSMPLLVSSNKTLEHKDKGMVAYLAIGFPGVSTLESIAQISPVL